MKRPILTHGREMVYVIGYVDRGELFSERWAKFNAIVDIFNAKGEEYVQSLDRKRRHNSSF